MIPTLVFCLDKVGDLIASTPLFDALHEAEPELRFILIVSPKNSEVLQGHPRLSEVRIYDPAASWIEKVYFIRNLRRLKPIYSFSLSPQPLTHWLSYVTGAGIRGGILQADHWFSRFLAPWLLHQRVRLFSKDPKKAVHKTQAVLDLAHKMGFSFSRTEKRSLTLPFFDKNTLKKVPAPRLFLHLGRGWSANGWSRETLLSFVQDLSLKLPQASLILTACEGKIDFTVEEVRPAYLFKGLSFGQWATLISQATAVITPNGSAVHIAGAQGIPAIVVYAPEKKAAAYKESGPYNTPHRALSQKEGPETLNDVLKSLRELFPFSKDLSIDGAQ